MMTERNGVTVTELNDRFAHMLPAIPQGLAAENARLVAENAALKAENDALKRRIEEAKRALATRHNGVGDEHIFNRIMGILYRRPQS
jgi:regulator of replication initiation timing